MKHRTTIEFPQELWNELKSTVPPRGKSRFIIEAVKEKLSRDSLHVLVLCGGEGTRMRPLTLTMPKPMLPLGYKPMLEHTLTFFKEQGFYHFIFAIGYLGESIVKYFGDGSKWDSDIEYSTEEKALGTGGAVKNAERYVNSTFIVTNGDVVFGNLDVRDVLEFHKEKDSLATIVLWKAEDASRFGLVEVGDDGRLENFIEKPRYPKPGWINAGLYVLEPEIFSYVPRGEKVSMESDIFPKILDEKRLYGYNYSGYWADIGIPEDYEEVSRDFLTNKAF